VPPSGVEMATMWQRASHHRGRPPAPTSQQLIRGQLRGVSSSRSGVAAPSRLHQLHRAAVEESGAGSFSGFVEGEGHRQAQDPREGGMVQCEREGQMQATTGHP
jgi:hypothetical protein